MKKSFILFDFDGVVADSYRVAFESQKVMCPHLSEADYKTRFEGNINEYEAPINHHTADCRLDLDFFDIYLPKMDRVIPVPGMREVVAELADQYILIVISSSITIPIEKLLEKFGLRNYFTEVMGNDVHKSKIEKMKMVFEKYKTTAKDCVFITDTLGDMREAAKMEVGAIGVTWGFHTPETLAKGEPFRLVEKPEEVAGAVNDYFAQ